MFYQFNPFTGSIKRTTQIQALYPLLPSKLLKGEPPAMMYDSIKTKAVQTNVTRFKSTKELQHKIKKIQEKYQADLEKPSYLLAGTRDTIMYRLSIAATVISFIINMYYMVQLEKKF